MILSWPLVLIGFAGGICLAYYKLWVLLLLLGIIMLLIAGWRPEYGPRIVTIIIALTGGMICYSFSAPDTPAQLPAQNGLELTGRVCDIPYYDGEKTNFVLQADTQEPYQQKIRVVCLFQTSLQRGDKVYVWGELKAPRQPGNPGEFDYPVYLAHQGIYYNLTVKQEAKVKLIAPASGALHWVDGFRQRAEDLTRTTLTPEEASILLGMLLGGKAGMGDELYDDFQKTGIVHLFSVGGLHVGFILALINWLCSLAGLLSRGKFVVGVSVLLIYGTMVGWPSPVIRAVLMGSLGLLAYLTGRENSLLNALAIASLFILFISPASLFILSFQLTVLATLGVVYLFPLFRAILPYKGLVGDIILIPICAELPILPLVAYHFNLFTPVSILTNIFTTYLSGGAVILGFMALLASSWLPAVAALLLYPAGLFIELILLVVGYMKMLPGAYVWVATPGIGLLLLYYGALILGVWSLHQSERKGFLKPSVALLLIFMVVLLLPGSWYNRGDFELVCIDVGQGDAILIKSPQGKFILVDGGGSLLFEAGKRKLMPYLHHRGIRQLEMIINTHPDIDHLQGVENAAQELEVKYLGIPASLAECNEYAKLKKIAAQKDIPIVALAAGQYVNLEEGLIIKVLHPQRETYTGNDFNQESVVLQISWGGFSALLTGDITADKMPLLLDKADPAPTIVKVPHHGSKGSLVPGFYNELQPGYAVISVAANNSFGHPHPLVLEDLRKANIEVLRTDQDGAITIRSDGRRYVINKNIEKER